MGTMITGPGSVPGMDSINSAFGQIYNMFGNLSGGGSGPFGSAPQPVSGADNSLTAQQRGTMNLLGSTAPGLIQGGGNLLGTGMGVAQGGLDMSGTGFGTTQTGLETLQPSVDFYTKILSGDPTATTAALAPTAANISAITSGATNQATAGMPAGGYRASTMAGLPFAEAAQVGNAALALQPQAAQALAALGGEQAGIGAQQAQIGQGVAGTGVNIGGLGTTLTGQGMQGLAQLINSLINKQQVNQQATPLTAFQQIVGNQGAGGILSGIGGILSAI